MTFREAYNHLDENTGIRRKGWNSVLFMRPSERTTVEVAKKFKSLPTIVKELLKEQPDEKEILITAYICLYQANGNIINGHEVSNLDKIENDWETVKI